MSLIAGAVGQKTILTDGAQVDHISENTSGHGVRIQGITNPTAYPVLAGDIGEKITWVTPPAGTTGVTSTSFIDWANANIVLTAGVWAIYGDIQLGCTVNSSQSGSMSIAIADSSDTIQDSGNAIRSFYYLNNNSATISTYHPLPIHAIVNPATTTTYKIRVKFSGTWAAAYILNDTSGNDGRSSFFAVRIA